MSLCPEFVLRRTMNDAEFWEHVFNGHLGPDIDDGYDPDELERTMADLTPCPVCHELGACGYDAEGRPLIHTIDEDDT